MDRAAQIGGEPNRTLTIAGRGIGQGYPCFVIAEAGVNHNGDIDLAHKLIDAAADAGADCVKFQTFKAESLVSPEARKAGYQLETTGAAETDQFSMLKALELSSEDHVALISHCRQRDIVFLSTPYDRDSLALLNRLDVAAIKIASTDTTNIPFLIEVDRSDRPVILSTGMCRLREVEEAVETLSATARTGRLAILQCTSQYPVPLEDVNLRAMATMADAFDCPVGFSDHSTGIETCGWAVALGASLVEKHMTLDRAMSGPDHRASLEPQEMRDLIRAIRRFEIARGDGRKRIMPSESGNKAVMQKSLMLTRDLAEGDRIDAADLVCKRPAGGLAPSLFSTVAGKVAARPLKADTPLRMADVRWE